MCRISASESIFLDKKMSSNDRGGVLSGVDAVKLIAAFCVMMIHMFPSGALFKGVFLRWAVPFFFLCSGYFLKDDVKGRVKYIGRVVTLYTVWFILYVLAFGKDNLGEGDLSVKIIIKTYLKGNFPGAFWYFTSLIACVIFITLLQCAIKNDFYVMIICSVLYTFAVMNTAYKNIEIFSFVNKTRILQLWATYYYYGLRDGICNGGLFVSIGICLKKVNMEKFRNKGRLILLIMVLFAYLGIEVILISGLNTGFTDVMPELIPLTVLIFILANQFKIKSSNAVFLRKMSTLVYTTHLGTGMIFNRETSSYQRFFLCMCVTVVFSGIFIKLSEKLKILRLLY